MNLSRRRFGRLLGAAAILLGSVPAMTAVTPTPALAATSRVLTYEFQWQETDFYCGPAATRIALTARGYFYSQNFLAHLLWTTKDGTNSAADTTRVLNAVGRTSFYVSKWIPGGSATQSEINRLQADVVYDIDRNYPIVANIIGSAMDTNGYWHTYSTGHYLTVVGYASDGWTVLITDPADARGIGTYWMTTTRLAHWIARRGYSA